MFARSQMTRPIGAETQTALESTNRVRSKTLRTSTEPIFGTRYGGISSVNAELSPLSTVLESIYDAEKVASTLKTITSVSIPAAAKGLTAFASGAAKNIEMIAIMVGKRPLQGTKAFVRIAMSRSLFESIIRQPTTPAALQPSPMHMQRLCFPQALHFLKQWSRLNATRGR